MTLTLYPTLEIDINVDEQTHDVDTLEQAGTIAAEYGVNGTVYTEQGFAYGYVHADGDWRAA